MSNVDPELPLDDVGEPGQAALECPHRLGARALLRSVHVRRSFVAEQRVVHVAEHGDGRELRRTGRRSFDAGETLQPAAPRLQASAAAVEEAPPEGGGGARAAIHRGAASDRQPDTPAGARSGRGHQLPDAERGGAKRVASGDGKELEPASQRGLDKCRMRSGLEPTRLPSAGRVARGREPQISSRHSHSRRRSRHLDGHEGTSECARHRGGRPLSAVGHREAAHVGGGQAVQDAPAHRAARLFRAKASLEGVHRDQHAKPPRSHVEGWPPRLGAGKSGGRRGGLGGRPRQRDRR